MEFIIENISKEMVIKMLQEEEKIRYSPQIQTLYTEQYYLMENDPNIERLNIELEIQKFILKKFGYTDSDNSVKNYWKIPSKYINDEDVKNSSFYIKLNIYKFSSFQIGDNLIDTQLIDYKSKNNILLSELQNDINKPLVILAGSIT